MSHRGSRGPRKVLIVGACILILSMAAFRWGGDAFFNMAVRMAQRLPPISEGYFDGDALHLSWSIPPGEGHLWFDPGVSFRSVKMNVWENHKSAARKISYLESALEAGLDEAWRPRALAELAYTHAVLEDYATAVPLFRDAWQSEEYRNENPRISLWLARAYRYVNRLDLAEAILREALDSASTAASTIEYEVRLELADVLEGRGAFREALEVALPSTELSDYDLISFKAARYLRYRIPRLERSLKYVEGEHRAIAGEITLNGAGLPGIRVIFSSGHEFKRSSKDGSIIGGSWYSPPQVAAQVVTDVDGRFELFDLEPGTYGVNVFIPDQFAAEYSVDYQSPVVEVREGETAWLHINFQPNPDGIVSGSRNHWEG